MHVNIWDQENYSDERPVSRLLHDSAELRLVAFFLKPGQVIEPHVAPSRVMMQVVKGRGSFTVGDRRIEVGPGELAVCEPNEPHGMEADEHLVIMAAIAPRPF
ncbi:MAG: cupin domain-containing protein [Firmicutes bacterium]|nr:cupin domain-containing protein [Bacillota bacterium]